MAQNQFSKFRGYCIAILFITGACALIYEITWHRYLANLIGSEARASAIILAVFLGGLAIGYELFGQLSHNRSQKFLLKLTGWLEIGIGIWAFFFPTLYEFGWETVTSWSGANPFTLFHEVGLASALILVPTILMGGTLPLLTQALSVDIEESGTIHAWIYAVNTAGAFFGCLVAGFILVPRLGLPITLMTVSIFNVIAGIVFIGFGTDADAKTPDKKQSDASGKSGFSLKSIFSGTDSLKNHSIAFLCGFIAITLQTALIRVVGLTAGSSEYAFAMVVAVFILMLAWGSFRVAKKPTGFFNTLWVNQLVVATGLIFLYLTIPYWPYSSHLLRTLFTSVVPNFYIYHVILFLVLTLILSIPIHAMGRSMPLLFKALANKIDSVGQNVGSIYFINTFGCVLGGIIGGYLLYFHFDLDQIIKLGIILALISAILASLGGTKNLLMSAVVTIVIVLVIIYPRWEDRFFAMGTFRDRVATSYSYQGREFYYKNRGSDQIEYRRDGPTSSMSIVTTAAPGAENYGKSLLVNGKSDGQTRLDRLTVQMIAHLPGLLSDNDLKQVAVIGFGTGMTAGSLSIYPQVEKVHVFEISPLVTDYAPRFDFANHGLSKSPKLVWHIGDAYQQMIGSSQKYALIASEPSNPWVTGVERLYTSEFLEVARSRLEKGGIYSQWFHLYDISLPTLKLVISTFQSVFPNVRIFTTFDFDMVILGSEEDLGISRIAKLQERWKIPVINEELGLLKIVTPADFLSREVLIPKEYFKGFGIHSLEYPKLSYQAGFDFFMGQPSDIRKVQDRPELRPWVRKFAPISLLNRWLNENNGSDRLIDLVKGNCDMEKLNISANWRASNRVCRQSIAEAVYRKAVPNKDILIKIEVDLLKAMAEPNNTNANLALVLPQISTPSEAQKALSFISDYDSPFFKTTPQLVNAVGEICRSGDSVPHLKCRVEFIKTLAGIGEWKQADKYLAELAKYSKLTPVSEIKVCIDTIEESARASSGENSKTTN